MFEFSSSPSSAEALFGVWLLFFNASWVLCIFMMCFYDVFHDLYTLCNNLKCAFKKIAKSTDAKVEFNQLIT
jgi:hypothetical protein